MTYQDESGPAFPIHPSMRPSDDQASAEGMSLRDWLAGLAMQAQVITDMVPGEAGEALAMTAYETGQDPVYLLALNSYEIADAMLKARKQ